MPFLGGDWALSYTSSNFQNCSKISKSFMVLSLKGPLSGLRKFLATESPLKMMKMLFIPF